MGRPIDADALKEYFPLPCEEWEMKGQQTLWEAREIWETIDRMPTVERKKGKWINNRNGTYECSECGCRHSRSNFCPNCGARMKEGTERC